MGKFLLTGARLLLLYDLTRGVDVGTKAEIFKTVQNLAAEGYGVLFYSSDIAELANVPHRVVVMFDGRVTADFPPGLSPRSSSWRPWWAGRRPEVSGGRAAVIRRRVLRADQGRHDGREPGSLGPAVEGSTGDGDDRTGGPVQWLPGQPGPFVPAERAARRRGDIRPVAAWVLVWPCSLLMPPCSREYQQRTDRHALCLTPSRW